MSVQKGDKQTEPLAYNAIVEGGVEVVDTGSKDWDNYLCKSFGTWMRAWMLVYFAEPISHYHLQSSGQWGYVLSFRRKCLFLHAHTVWFVLVPLERVAFCLSRRIRNKRIVAVFISHSQQYIEQRGLEAVLRSRKIPDLLSCPMANWLLCI